MRRGRIVAGLLFMLSLAGCSPLFLLRASYEEIKILTRREPIARLVQDPDVPEERRDKLELVLSVRDFAADSLGLDVEESYTTFSQLDSDTLALVLSGAYKDRFEPYTWWFPIVGRVPYRAYFSESSVERAVRGLEAKGLDAYVRPTSAFSTLGWFNDPLVSSLLRYDSVTLSNTVVHELTHNTIYLPGQATFNESLATFSGARGAIEYFCDVRKDEALCQRAEDYWRDELRFGAFLTDLVDRLERLYGREDLTSEQKIEQREEIFSESVRRFQATVEPELEVLSFRSFSEGPINNAFLIARRIYYQDLDLFESVFQAYGGELREVLPVISEAARDMPDDPYAGVRALLPEADFE